MTHEHADRSQETRPVERGFRLTAGDLIGDLLWPKLLRLPALAARPERVFLGVLLVVFVAGVDSLGAKITGGDPLIAIAAEGWAGGMELAVHAGASGDAKGVFVGVLDGFRGAFSNLLDSAWLRTVVLGPVLLAVSAMFVLAMSRIAALDFALGRSCQWPEAVGFAVRHWSSLASAIVGPLAVVGAVWLLLAAVGFVLLGVPGLSVVGALLWPVALVLGLVAVVLLICMGLGGVLMIPAIACEDSDGIDAVQRSFSYALSRPLRLAVFVFLALLIGWVSVSIAGAVAESVVGFASDATSAWGSDRAGAIARGESDYLQTEGIVHTEEISGLDSVAVSLIGFFSAIPGLLVAGFAASFAASSGTVVYLLMRRVADGQDVADLYMPDEISRRIEQTLEARGADAGAQASSSDDKSD